MSGKPTHCQALHSKRFSGVDCFEWMTECQRASGLYFNEGKDTVRVQRDDIDFTFADSPVTVDDFDFRGDEVLGNDFFAKGACVLIVFSVHSGDDKFIP